MKKEMEINIDKVIGDKDMPKIGLLSEEEVDYKRKVLGSFVVDSLGEKVYQLPGGGLTGQGGWNMFNEAAWFFTSYTHDAYNTEFRVPYLTKEQIEAEGWKRFTINTLVRDNNSITLLENNKILISQNQMVSFCGECKDINTFRYIIKLLGI